MTQPRKKKLVKSRLQLRMTAVFLAVACSSAMFQVVVLNWSLLRFASDFSVQSEQLLEGMPRLLLTNLGLTFAVLVPAMLYFGIQVTHRIAGPIYRMELFLDGIIEGKVKGRCSIRKTDELHEMCDKLNRAVEVLRQQALEQDETTSEGDSEGDSEQRAA